MPFQHLHDNPPPPFNPEFRPGFGEALSAAYTQWSEAHPNHTREEGQEAHARLAEELTPQFPKVGE